MAAQIAPAIHEGSLRARVRGNQPIPPGLWRMRSHRICSAVPSAPPPPPLLPPSQAKRASMWQARSRSRSRPRTHVLTHSHPTHSSLPPPTGTVCSLLSCFTFLSFVRVLLLAGVRCSLFPSPSPPSCRSVPARCPAPSLVPSPLPVPACSTSLDPHHLSHRFCAAASAATALLPHHILHF